MCNETRSWLAYGNPICGEIPVKGVDYVRSWACDGPQQCVTEVAVSIRTVDQCLKCNVIVEPEEMNSRLTDEVNERSRYLRAGPAEYPMEHIRGLEKCRRMDPL